MEESPPRAPLPQGQRILPLDISPGDRFLRFSYQKANVPARKVFTVEKSFTVGEFGKQDESTFLYPAALPRTLARLIHLPVSRNGASWSAGGR